MLTFLLKLIFCTISTLSNIVSRLIFSATAYLLVLLIHAFKVPGEAVQGGLEKLAEAIKSGFEYLLELIIELTGSFISSAFNQFIEVVTSSASASGAAFGSLAVKMRRSLEELFTDLPEIAEGFWEMISTMVTDLWNNYKYALGYVTENA